MCWGHHTFGGSSCLGPNSTGRPEQGHNLLPHRIPVVMSHTSVGTTRPYPRNHRLKMIKEKREASTNASVSAYKIKVKEKSHQREIPSPGDYLDSRLSPAVSSGWASCSRRFFPSNDYKLIPEKVSQQRHPGTKVSARPGSIPENPRCRQRAPNVRTRSHSEDPRRMSN